MPLILTLAATTACATRGGESDGTATGAQTTTAVSPVPGKFVQTDPANPDHATMLTISAVTDSAVTFTLNAWSGSPSALSLQHSTVSGSARRDDSAWVFEGDRCSLTLAFEGNRVEIRTAGVCEGNPAVPGSLFTGAYARLEGRPHAVCCETTTGVCTDGDEGNPRTSRVLACPSPNRCVLYPGRSIGMCVDAAGVPEGRAGRQGEWCHEGSCAVGLDCNGAAGPVPGTCDAPLAD